MTVKAKYIEVITCDRCKNEIVNSHYETRIGNLRYRKYKKTIIGRLSWMKMRNGGGSQDSHMSMDLCAPCTETFLFFMSNK